MKLIIDHSYSVFHNNKVLILLESQRENESTEYMFENGWIPYYHHKEEWWYQSKSSRLKIQPISKRRKKELQNLKISDKTSNTEIEIPSDIEYYNFGNYEDFYFDDLFWGRFHFFENQIIYSIMNKTKSKKSYGTLSYYYLLDKFFGKFDYLYITDYFEEFSYKENLPNFEYWDGKKWVKKYSNYELSVE